MSVGALTLQGTVGREPFDWYRAMREKGGVVWDDELDSWVATSHEAVRQICRLDEISFRRKDAEGGSEYNRMSGGRRTLKVLSGDAHRTLHSWMMSAFTPKRAAELQESVVRDVVATLLDRVAPLGRAELTSDLLNKIPGRVIASVLDLPWRDEQWIETANSCVTRVFAFYNQRGYDREDLVERASGAYVEMRELLDPILQERSAGAGDDLISGLWKVGPEVLPDWNIEDVFINVTSLFLGGSHTSTLALANAFYLLLGDPDLEREVRTSDERLRAFVEQALRLHPPQHYQQRRVLEDVTVSGVDMKQGDMVTLVFASANRDETHYATPESVDLDQKVQRDHVTFSAGPHSCVGQGLARAEVVETLRQTLSRLLDLRLDEERVGDIRYEGLSFRGYGPLPVVFTPEVPAQERPGCPS